MILALLERIISTVTMTFGACRLEADYETRCPSILVCPVPPSKQIYFEGSASEAVDVRRAARGDGSL